MKTLDSAAAEVNDLESRVGVPPGFFRKLLDEDDWTFVIKLHALFEAACTHLLLYHFREPNLAQVFSRLELSGKTTGKLEFLGHIGLLGKERRRFISSLSELRNSLVHDVRNCEFELKAFVGKLPPDALKTFAVSFSPFESGVRKISAAFPITDEELLEQAQIGSLRERALENPKLHIWLGAFDVLVSILEMYSYSEYKQWAKAREIFNGEE
jgi:hypothetical protein